MTIIVDASVVISALINPAGKEASIIFNFFGKVDFVAPDLMYEVVLLKKNKIIASSHINEFSLAESLLLIYNTISVLSVEKYQPDV